MMIRWKYFKKALLLFIAFQLLLPCQIWAYNKSWDQGHTCVNPSGGYKGWGKYDREGVFRGGYSNKECCQRLCKICPVYANTGQLQKTFTDLSVPGIGPSLTIVRTYESQDWASSLLGRGWMFNFGKKLIISRSNEGEKIIVIRQETGEKNFFEEDPNGTLWLLADYGVTYELIKDESGNYVIINRDGSIQYVNADGRITSKVDKNGNELLFEYGPVGCLSRIINASGNYVDFQLGPNGKIASISDNLGRTVNYTYDENGNLISSTDPMGYSTQYVYDSENRLIQIIDPRGNPVFVITYDGFQPSRVATFTEKGETWTINYNYQDDRTIKTDSSGNSWTYFFNDVGIIEKVIDPLGNVKQQYPNKVTSTSLDWDEDKNGNRTTYTYDEYGNITSRTNPLGNTWTYAYLDMTNRIETETDPCSVVTKYQYDTNGNHTAVIRDFNGSLENTTIYAYDSNGNKTSVTNPLGSTTTYEYDENGNVTEINDPLGNITSYTYDNRGNNLTETDPIGNTTTYTYDLMNRLLSVTDALGGTTTYTYDASGNRTSETNANGDTKTYDYDAYNRLVQVTNPLGNTTLYTYDSRDNRTSMTDGNGNTTMYTYDILNRLTRKTDALGGQTNYTHDAAGNILTITDACGNTTTFTYDEMNRKVSETNAAGETTTYSYGFLGNLKKVVLSNGNKTEYDYDKFGRITKVIDAEGHYRIREYDNLDRVTKETTYDKNNEPLMQSRTKYDALDRVVQQAVMTDATSTAAVDTSVDMAVDYNYTGTYKLPVSKIHYYNGGNTAVTSYYYDQGGRLKSTTDPMDNETLMIYDGLGRLTRMQRIWHNPLGSNDVNMITDYEYDLLGRVIEQTDKPNLADSQIWQTTKFKYDALGNRLEITKPNGVVTKYSYDVLGRLVEKTADYGTGNINQKTDYGYDGLGRLKTIISYADGVTAQMTTYTYDSTGRVINILYPDDNQINFEYWPAGKVRKCTDQRGIITTYSYDKMNNLLTKIVDGAGMADDVQETFTYDGLGRILTAEKTVNSTTISQLEFAYNDLGVISDVNEQPFTYIKREMNYTYDQAGHLVSRTYPDNTLVETTTDSLGRIDTLVVNNTTIATYKYIGQHVAERKYPDPAVDVVYQLNYDNLGRLTTAHTYQGGSDIIKFAHEYDPNTNNITLIKYDHRTNDPCNAFSYDNLDRLTVAEYGVTDSNEVFSMDKLGNRNSVNLKSGSGEDYVIDTTTNRYNSIGGNDLEYDKAGNLIKDKDGYEYEYDYENRIVKITKDTGNIAEFAYDALGRRIQKVDSITGETTLYYYGSGWQVLAEYDGSNNFQRRFVYGNYIDEPLVMNDGTSNYYYVQDHLYSTAALLDLTGSVVERYEYDAYGQPYILDTQYVERSTSLYDNPYMFTGRRVDTLDNGGLTLQYNRNRYYDYYTGRWLTHDPSGYFKGINLYSYVECQPFIAVDPFGLWHWPWTKYHANLETARMISLKAAIEKQVDYLKMMGLSPTRKDFCTSVDRCCKDCFRRVVFKHCETIWSESIKTGYDVLEDTAIDIPIGDYYTFKVFHEKPMTISAPGTSDNITPLSGNLFVAWRHSSEVVSSGKIPGVLATSGGMSATSAGTMIYVSCNVERYGLIQHWQKGWTKAIIKCQARNLLSCHLGYGGNLMDVGYWDFNIDFSGTKEHFEHFEKPRYEQYTVYNELHSYIIPKGGNIVIPLQSEYH